MKSHDTFLELAAVAIDFPLTPDERTHLDQHLAGCAACARTATGLHVDALSIESLPAITLPERRGAEILAAVLHPQVVSHRLRLLAIAALLGLALIGSLVAGAGLLRDSEENPLVVVPPLPTGTAAPAESLAPTASPAPSASAATSPATESPEPVLRMDWIVDTGTPVDATVVMADGLVVWNDPSDGQQQRHLTPAGVVWVRDQLSDNGLLGQDAAYDATQKPGTDPPGGGATLFTFVAYRDGVPVTVTASIPSQFDERYWSASDRLLGLVALGREVVDADAWVPAQYWRDAPAPYEPSTYLFTVRMSRLAETSRWDDVDTVDWPLPVAPDLYGDRMESSTRTEDLRCTVVGSALAGQLARAMEPTDEGVAATLRGREHNYGWSRGPGALSINIERALPDEADCSARYQVPEASPLGASWSPAVVPAVTGRPVGRIEAVTAGGPGFVAVGRGCTGLEPVCEAIVWTSTDGRAWDRAPASDATNTGASIPTSGPEMGMYDVAANDRGVVAIGYAARPDMAATAWFSPDGAAWERIPLGDADTYRVNAVAADGNRFVIVGEDRSDYTGGNLATAAARAAVWTSTDGRSWSRVPHTDDLDVGGFTDTLEDPATGGMADVTSGPGGFVAVGSTCPTRMDPYQIGDDAPQCTPAAWVSETGVDWRRASEMPALAGWLSSVAASGSFSERAYVAVGLEVTCENGIPATGGDLCMYLVLTSEDGAAWTREPIQEAGRFASVARIGGRFVAVPVDGPLWDSVDGGSWAPAEVTGGSTAQYLDASRLASRDGIAVWIGASDQRESDAWVSVAAAPSP